MLVTHSQAQNPNPIPYYILLLYGSYYILIFCILAGSIQKSNVLCTNRGGKKSKMCTYRNNFSVPNLYYKVIVHSVYIIFIVYCLVVSVDTNSPTLKFCTHSK